MNIFDKVREQEDYYFRTIEDFLINGNIYADSIKSKTYWRFRVNITRPLKSLIGRM